MGTRSAAAPSYPWGPSLIEERSGGAGPSPAGTRSLSGFPSGAPPATRTPGREAGVRGGNSGRTGGRCLAVGEAPCAPEPPGSGSPPSRHPQVCGVHPGSAARVQKDFFPRRKMRSAWFFMSTVLLFFFFAFCSFHLGVGNLCCIGVVKHICPQTVDRNKCGFFVFQKTSASGLSDKVSFLTGQPEAVVIFRSNRRSWSRWGRGTFIFSRLFNF